MNVKTDLINILFDLLVNINSYISGIVTGGGEGRFGIVVAQTIIDGVIKKYLQSYTFLQMCPELFFNIT